MHTRYPEISFDNPQMKAEFGTSVCMRCNIGDIHPSITEVWWTKGYDNALIQGDGVKYERKNFTSYTSLKVLNVNENDTGEYRCYAKNAKGAMFANATLVTGGKSLYVENKTFILYTHTFLLSYNYKCN